MDRRGLKSQYLGRHKDAISDFLDSVVSMDFSSELANKYKKRFQKNGAKMFTFLDRDGIPWNNNVAEHAIKRFAKFRRHADGRFTESSLNEYLILASIFETCALNNINVLKFLLSKETTLDGLFKMTGHKVKENEEQSGSKIAQSFTGDLVPYGRRCTEVPDEAHKADVQARYFVRTKQFRKAAQAYTRAIQAAPGWPVVRFNAALTFAKFSAYSQAIDQMKCYLKFSPHSGNAQTAKDNIAKWKTQMQGSAGDLVPWGSRRVDIPKEAYAADRQARYFVRSKQFKKAAQAYARAIQLAPGWPVVRFNQAVILAKLAAYGQAIDQMKCYLKLSPYAFNVQTAKDKIAEWETQVPRSLDNDFFDKRSSDRIQEKTVVS